VATRATRSVAPWAGAAAAGGYRGCGLVRTSALSAPTACARESCGYHIQCDIVISAAVAVIADGTDKKKHHFKIVPLSPYTPSSTGATAVKHRGIALDRSYYDG